MENKDLPAYPTLWQTTHGPDWQTDGGLTKREYFAAMALQGIFAGTKLEDLVSSTMFESIAADAISAADALLNQLDKQQ